MKISAIKPGQIVFSVEKRDSNVLSMSKSKKRLKTVMVYPVFIKEVNEEEGYVVASWNSNSPKKFYESSVSKWKKEEPMTVKQAFGLVRLATKAERDAANLVRLATKEERDAANLVRLATKEEREAAKAVK